MQKFIIFFLGAFGLSFDVAAFSVKQDMFITIGAFDASKTELTYTFTPKNYQINSHIRTNGFFNKAYPFQADYLTSGKINGNQMITENYSYTSQSRFNTRGKQVIYNSKGEPQYQISVKNGKKQKKDFVPSPSPADTFDLQTVLAKLARQYNEVGFCDSQISVYDGKRHFNVVFKDEGVEDLPQNEHLFLKGKAAKCSLHINKLLSEDDDALWEFSANKPVYFWIVRNNETKYPVIARIQIKDTPLGELNAYTSQFTIKE